MHDPHVLLFDVRRRYKAGRKRRSWDWLLDVLDVWHVEPRGHDSGEVCGRYPRPIGKRLWWAWQHRDHLEFTVKPYRKVRRWLFDRCDGCGRRFLWKDSRHGYMSGDATYHDVCMSLRSVKSVVEDYDAYMVGEADDNARWRVEYRIKHLDTKQPWPGGAPRV
jgi:hypothetical protein